MNPPDANSSGREANEAAREKLITLRLALLKLHKTLLDMERREYERANGKVTVGELFRLVIDHQQFGWLHNISEFVVRLDETLAGETPVTPEDVRTAISLARKMFAHVTEQLLRTIGQTQGLHQLPVIGKNHCHALFVDIDPAKDIVVARDKYQ